MTEFPHPVNPDCPHWYRGLPLGERLQQVESIEAVDGVGGDSRGRTLGDSRGRTLGDSRGRTLGDSRGRTLGDSHGRTLRDRRKQRWQAQNPLTNPEIYAIKLEQIGLTPEQWSEILGETATSLASRSLPQLALIWKN